MTLREQGEAVNAGNLTQAEAMLINQATALQSLFARLTERALDMDLLQHFEAFMRMALRAQSQCRATLETLAAIKNPPVVYARQANVTTGPQQNNFGVARGEAEIKRTELLETNDGERLDTRTTAQAVRSDTTLEALDAKHGAKDTGGKGAVSDEPRPGRRPEDDEGVAEVAA